MATTANSRTNSDAASVPFSYAQAAKGLVAAPGSSTSKASSSGAVTPAKDSQSASTSAATVMSWAEDAEGNESRPENTEGSNESRTLNTKSAAAPSELTAAALASPEIGASTASTVTKDDDVSSIPNTSSDSTWENKSQASTSVDKSTEPSEKSSQKGKGKKREQAPAKPLQEAPLPAVNVWQQRAELRKPAKPATAAASSNGSVNGTSASKQSKDVENRVAANEVKTRGVEEERVNPVRQESKEADSHKARKNTRARPQERDAREAPGVVSLPPERDQESWPTMDAATAIDEDRKKALEKTEKSDKERKESAGAKSKGQWVKVPFVPSVNFNTPLPSSGARRGGRGPARGGAQNGGRAGLSTSGPEKDTSSPAATANGDLPRRGRPDVPIRETSPKAKRTASASSLATKDKAAQLNGEKSKSTPAEIDSQSKENGVLPEEQNNVSGPNGHTTFPRQYPSNRPSKGKRTEWSGPDRRREGDSSAPPKENGVSTDRASASTQTDGPEDAERRTFPEGQAPFQSKRGAGDRYGSYNSRERRGGRGGGRGGNFSNGHQFPNGHIKSSSTYPGPMSPTAFNPEQSPYFPQSRYRNGPRSQSVTNENTFRMPGQFGGPPQMPPINTYMGGNGYDYPMMQPMSAAPFGQFGMDHFAMFSMVTTQLEYYFSLDNLCKDMYLRKHMDSKGFVFLSFIADFNRIKHLTTDLELVKLVCYQSRAIEFRVGHDGKDRLRARENWQQWVMPVEERDPSAQNEGPEELYNPPIPHPNGFDPNGNPRYPDMSTPSPSAPGAYGTEGPHPTANGFHPGAPQHLTSESVPNGVNAEHVNGDAISNGQHTDDSIKAVSVEPNFFFNEQIESFSVIV
ncbi:HTH La-type RNA-binding protein [Paraphaeosphaeria minitans]|uniref:HTH La-type RNA-binding protein n=1 Tax=Paraphaeosphaeria minitans TaxID=565426 RepID=A0A9P6GSB1_9PLEO|nr:HTH La-type RNA-binding protein [Paraphaeosphaeria minitans]